MSQAVNVNIGTPKKCSPEDEKFVEMLAQVEGTESKFTELVKFLNQLLNDVSSSHSNSEKLAESAKALAEDERDSLQELLQLFSNVINEKSL